MITYPPENLSVWDRLFNRHKTIPVEQGNEDWSRNYAGVPIGKYNRDFVVYHVVDRLTGAYTIEKRYLN